jgi:hypothetical protein
MDNKDSVIAKFQVLESIMRETYTVDAKEWNGDNRIYIPFNNRCMASSLVIKENIESPNCWRRKLEGESHCIIHESYTNMLSKLNHAYDIYTGYYSPLGRTYSIPGYLILNSPDVPYEDFKNLHDKYNSMYQSKFGYILYTLITAYVVHVRNFRSRWQLKEKTKSNEGHKYIYDKFETNMKYMAKLFGITINVNRNRIITNFENRLEEDLIVIRRVVELIDELIKNKEKYYYLSIPINRMYALAVKEEDRNPIMTMIYNYPITVRPEFKLSINVSLVTATYAIGFGKPLPFGISNMLVSDGARRNIRKYHIPILDREVIKLPLPLDINSLGYVEDIQEDICVLHSSQNERPYDSINNYSARIEGQGWMGVPTPIISMSAFSPPWSPP